MGEIIIVILFGWLGVHKFIQKKTGLGILYLLTFGLCGIGWIVDIIKAILKYKNQNQKRIPNYFYVAGMYYHEEDIKSIMQKSNRSDYVYRVKEDYAVLVPEPDNIHDRNAIAVYMNKVKIGYVPADITTMIRPLIGTHDFIGTITGGDMYSEEGILKKDFKCSVRMENRQ